MYIVRHYDGYVILMQGDRHLVWAGKPVASLHEDTTYDTLDEAVSDFAESISPMFHDLNEEQVACTQGDRQLVANGWPIMVEVIVSLCG